MREMWLDELGGTVARDHWGRAIAAIGWMHLGASIRLQWFFATGRRTEWYYVATWASEVLGIVLIMRTVAGRGWYRASPALGVVVRIWATYLILAFSMASTSHLSGSAFEWYRPG